MKHKKLQRFNGKETTIQIWIKSLRKDSQVFNMKLLKSEDTDEDLFHKLLERCNALKTDWPVKDEEESESHCIQVQISRMWATVTLTRGFHRVMSSEQTSKIDTFIMDLKILLMA